MIAILALAAAATLAPPPLEPLLARIRVVVPDAREVRDLQVCAPQQVSRDGRRATVLVALSRPREARRYYRAVWRDGRFVDLADLGLSGSDEGLYGVAARALERRFEECRFIAADELAAGWSALDRRP
jgi:hypothetical protein